MSNSESDSLSFGLEVSPLEADSVCSVCSVGELKPLRNVDGVRYYRCVSCGTILVESSFLDRTMAGEARVYDESYWADEIVAARERCYGASLIRLAEVFAYARRPVRRFLDVSSGAGFLLDAASELLPEIADTFWGIEPFPPPPAFRSRHSHYCVGFLSSLAGRFDGGTCIEVIEHLPPLVLKQMSLDLAAVSEPAALWYFNSAQPDYVEASDPGYLDPYKRGHIASYSLDALRYIFGKAGFTLHALPGRGWAFLAEYGDHPPQDGNDLLTRVWTMLPENRDLLAKSRFGNLLLAAAIESGQCYVESAMRAWAIDERAILMRQNSELKSANGKIGRFLTSLTHRFRKFSLKP